MKSTGTKQELLQAGGFPQRGKRRHPETPGGPAAGPEAAVLAESAQSAPDLRQEAANMLALASTQSGLETPLGLSSQGAQVVLKQF